VNRNPRAVEKMLKTKFPHEAIKQAATLEDEPARAR
jgi:hypothetical protein